MTDPIEFEISPYIRKSDYDATFTGATISVYLPVELEIFQDVDDKAYNTQTSGGEVTLDVDENGTIVQRRYIVYNYDYSQEDIMFATDSSSGTKFSSFSLIIKLILSIFSWFLFNLARLSSLRFLYFKTPAASSNITRLSSGFSLKIWSILFSSF